MSLQFRIIKKISEIKNKVYIEKNDSSFSLCLSFSFFVPTLICSRTKDSPASALSASDSLLLVLRFDFLLGIRSHSMMRLLLLPLLVLLLLLLWLLLLRCLALRLLLTGGNCCCSSGASAGGTPSGAAEAARP